VQPIASLVQSLLAKGIESVIVTHKAHACWLLNGHNIEEKHIVSVSTRPVEHSLSSFEEVMCFAESIYTTTVRQQNDDSHQMISSDRDTAIVSNLFALESLHIARKLGVRWISLSPFVPQPAPDTIAFELLQSHAFSNAHTTVQSAISRWLWPVLTDKFDSLRTWLGCETHTLDDLLSCSKDSSIFQLHLSLDPRFLSARSNELQPPRIDTLGFLQRLWKRKAFEKQPSPTIPWLEADASTAVVVLTLGSAAHVAPEPTRKAIANAAERCADTLHVRLLILGAAAHSGSLRQSDWWRWFLDDDDVDLERIFSRSSIVCFHGGIGTAAAAISSNPAPALVVLPLHFDQHANARLLEAQFQAAHVSPEGDVTDDLHAAISSKLANRLVRGAHDCEALGGDNAQASAGVERLCKLLACERVSPKLTR
jgi:hypothetical protein